MDLTSVVATAAAALSLILLISTPTSIQAAVTPAAPAPSPPRPVNITAILAKGGQYATFIRFLTQTTQVADQINNQLNNSNQGMTVFAPTDNAFSNLPAGTLNNLTPNQQVQLVQYHVMPRYYSLTDLLSVSNPVPTQAAGPDGRVYGLNFTGQGSQLNISTGVVDTQLNNALSQENVEGLLAVYSVDKVLLPKEFYEAPAPAAADVAAPAPKAAKSKPSEAAADQAEPRSSGSVIGGQKSTTSVLAAAAGIGLLCLGGLLS